MSPVRTVPPPTNVWRVGRGPDPLEIREPLSREDLDRPHTGNRWDDPLGVYPVLYFGTTLEACYGETTARFRPDLGVIEFIRDEWEARSFVQLGGIPADWRFRRLAVNVSMEDSLPFVDIDAPETMNELRVELASSVATLGVTDIDLSVVTSSDRRVTRMISRWVFDQRGDDGEPLYDGIRYTSRVGEGWECWAAFADDVELEELESRPILRSDPSLLAVAKAYKLIVF